jgi:hypothetical protein
MKKFNWSLSLEEFLKLFIFKDFKPFVEYDKNSDEIVCQLKDCSFTEVYRDGCILFRENHLPEELNPNWIGMRFNASDKLFYNHFVPKGEASAKELLSCNLELNLIYFYHMIVNLKADIPKELLKDIFEASCGKTDF